MSLLRRRGQEERRRGGEEERLRGGSEEAQRIFAVTWKSFPYKIVHEVVLIPTVMYCVLDYIDVKVSILH